MLTLAHRSEVRFEGVAGMSPYSNNDSQKMDWDCRSHLGLVERERDRQERVLRAKGRSRPARPVRQFFRIPNDVWHSLVALPAPRERKGTRGRLRKAFATCRAR